MGSLDDLQPSCKDLLSGGLGWRGPGRSTEAGGRGQRWNAIDVNRMVGEENALYRGFWQRLAGRWINRRHVGGILVARERK